VIGIGEPYIGGPWKIKGREFEYSSCKRLSAWEETWGKELEETRS
jgi:hypothetical protein